MATIAQSTIHQEVLFDASPKRVYDALMDSKMHAEFTGAPAEISDDAGGAFTAHGGYVSGRNVELVRDTRIVQAWRGGDWEPGVYSIVRYELRPQGDKTLLVFDHAAFPEGTGEHLASGWHNMYWEPLRKYLS